MPANLDALVVAILFVMPGFIAQAVVGACVPRRQRGANEVVLEAVVYGSLNAALFGWLLLLALPAYGQQPVVWRWLMLAGAGIGVLLVGPLVLGLVGAWLVGHGVLGRLLRRFGLRFVDPVPRAWDFYFGQRKQGSLRVTLTGDAIVAGFMGTRSFASSSPGPTTSTSRRCTAWTLTAC